MDKANNKRTQTMKKETLKMVMEIDTKEQQRQAQAEYLEYYLTLSTGYKKESQTTDLENCVV